MAFNTTSFLAGVGSVVAVLSTGLAGGYFLANPSHINPPNRLQRLAAANQDSKPAQVAAPVTTPAKPEVVATAAPAAAAAPDTEQAAQPAAQAAAPTAPRVVALAETKAPEPAPAAAVQETTASAPPAKPDTDAKASVEKTNADKARAAEARSADARAAEARAAEKKRSESRRIAEQQRKQRELEVATTAVRRIIHARDGSDVADSDQTDASVADTPAAEMPHFNLFGQ
jgi:hypothetical protein